jgi:hypothetical protein
MRTLILLTPSLALVEPELEGYQGQADVSYVVLAVEEIVRRVEDRFRPERLALIRDLRAWVEVWKEDDVIVNVQIGISRPWQILYP